MKWLLLVDRKTDLHALARKVRQLGGELDPTAATPMGEHELAVEAEGPNDLQGKATSLDEVKAVYPNSEQTPY